MRIRSFQGLRPTPKSALEVASPPYDVVNATEARAIASSNPLSFLHVIRAEIDLPESTSPYEKAVYAKARANLELLQKQGALVRESEPCLYLYRQIMGDHSQTGLVTICHLEDYEQGLIRKHETTRKTKEDDRTALNQALQAHPGPVFLTYRDEPRIETLNQTITQTPPYIDFTAPDGVQHTLWRIPGGEAYVEAFSRIPVAYVADGHHRSASAARVAKACREANPHHTGQEDYNWFLAVLFPANQLQILPYHRVAKTLNGLSPEAFLAKLRETMEVTEGAPPAPVAPGQISLYLSGKWYRLLFPQKSALGLIESLDVSQLQVNVLKPILGIDDPRTSDQLDFVGGIRGTTELEKQVDSGEYAAAFSLYPLTCDQLMAIADAGEIMPPKSTWFEPKLRSGLVVHTF